jgi:hypothetical protein
MTVTLDEKKITITCGALLAWLAVILQLALMIRNRTTSTAEALARFFTYFTILTNILAALCFTLILGKPSSSGGKFFARPRTQTAIAIYILMVGIVYNTILRSLWHPQGYQRIADELLHVVNPAFFLLYWLFFVRKSAAAIPWTSLALWLLYPLGYLILILLRGALSGWYPYPFMDVVQLGFGTVLIHSAGMLAAFLLLSVLFLGLAKATGSKKAPVPGS